MRRYFFIFVFAISFSSITLIAQAATQYPRIAKIKWLEKNTKATVTIPGFFKKNKGGLVQELYSAKHRSSTVVPISENSIAFTLPLGLEYAPSGKYTVSLAFCREGVKTIIKKDCGPVLKKTVKK